MKAEKDSKTVKDTTKVSKAEAAVNVAKAATKAPVTSYDGIEIELEQVPVNQVFHARIINFRECTSKNSGKAFLVLTILTTIRKSYENGSTEDIPVKFDCCANLYTAGKFTAAICTNIGRTDLLNKVTLYRLDVLVHNTATFPMMLTQTTSKDGSKVYTNPTCVCDVTKLLNGGKFI